MATSDAPGLAQSDLPAGARALDPAPEVAADIAVDGGGGGSERAVALFAGVLVAAVFPLVALLEPGPPLQWHVVVLVLLLYVAGELAATEIEFRRETHTFAFTSVPLVIGILLLPPTVVLALRLASSALLFSLVWRQPALKLAVNLASHTTEVVLAALVVQAVGVPDTLGPRAWVSAALAVTVTDLVSAGVITVAISLYEGRWDRTMLAGIWVPMGVTLVDVSLAVVVATFLSLERPEVWLVAPIALFMAAVTRAYGRLSSRYRGMLRLDGFARDLGAAVGTETVHARLLGEAVEVLHADLGWLWWPDRPDSGKLVQHVDGELRTEPVGELEVALLAQLGRSAERFDRHGALGDVLTRAGQRELIARRLDVGDGGQVVLCVADRSGAVRAFDREDVLAFDTLASHAAVALSNSELVDRIRADSVRYEYLATHDTLTSLPNRDVFTERVRDAIEAGVDVAVLLIDLDRFKDVNDTLGHAWGDELLVEAAVRLQTTLEPGDLLARLGGDEFVLLLAADEQQALARARRCIEVLQDPFAVAGVEVTIEASVGIAPTEEGVDAASLLRRADVAMYAAKADRSGTALYSPDRDDFSPHRLALVGRLRRAIADGELELHYQPQIDLDTGAVVGVEALVRWPRPGRPPHPPAEFVPVAERTELIRPLTRLVLSRAIDQASAWRRGGRPLTVSVNLSARNLSEPDLVDFIAGEIERTSLPPELLEIELTETVVMASPERAAAVMDRLRRIGVRIAIDDFGTGHSSLSQLTALSLDRLKVDRSFILAMATSDTAMTIVQAVVDLARNLGLDTIAEGVETAQAVEALRAIGCAAAQGYHWSRPVPAAELEAWLETYERRAVAGPAVAAPALPR